MSFGRKGTPVMAELLSNDLYRDGPRQDNALLTQPQRRGGFHALFSHLFFRMEVFISPEEIAVKVNNRQLSGKQASKQE